MSGSFGRLTKMKLNRTDFSADSNWVPAHGADLWLKNSWLSSAYRAVVLEALCASYASLHLEFSEAFAFGRQPKRFEINWSPYAPGMATLPPRPRPVTSPPLAMRVDLTAS